MSKRVVYTKTYDGFEEFSDYWRDMHEACLYEFNPEWVGIPGAFQGKVTVTIEYEDEAP